MSVAAACKKFNANRKTIRTCLLNYKIARLQHEAILKDTQIQGYFEAGARTEAIRLIDQKYPFGKWDFVRERGLDLIKIMIDGTPASHVDPEEFWRNPDTFDEMVALAGRV
jgi:hypothetical protein